MNLRALVRALGPAAAARRLGISLATLKVWLAKGPSSRGKKKVAEVAKRRRAGQKAQKTRRQRDEFEERIPIPAEELDIPAEQARPRTPPTRRQVESFEGFIPEGQRRRDTDRYIGETHTFTIGAPVTLVEVDDLIDLSVKTWQDSDRTLCMLNFLFFRYIPFNPLYKGEMVKKQGKWFDWWTSTSPQSSQSAIANAIQNVFTGYDTYRDGKKHKVIGALEAAETRIIWLEQVQIHTFDDKQQLPDIKTIMGRSLRRV